MTSNSFRSPGKRLTAAGSSATREVSSGWHGPPTGSRRGFPQGRTRRSGRAPGGGGLHGDGVGVSALSTRGDNSVDNRTRVRQGFRPGGPPRVASIQDVGQGGRLWITLGAGGPGLAPEFRYLVPRLREGPAASGRGRGLPPPGRGALARDRIVALRGQDRTVRGARRAGLLTARAASRTAHLTLRTPMPPQGAWPGPTQNGAQGERLT